MFLLGLFLSYLEVFSKTADEHIPVCMLTHAYRHFEHLAHKCQARAAADSFSVPSERTFSAGYLLPSASASRGSTDCTLILILRERQLLSEHISESPSEKLIQQILQKKRFLLFSTFHSSVAYKYIQCAATRSSASQRVVANRASVFPFHP